MKHFKLIAVVIAGVWFQGCAVTLTMPASRFDSPEVVGQIGKFRAAAGVGTDVEATLTSDYTISAPNGVDPAARWRASAGFLNLQAGLMPWLDVQYKSFNYVQAKAQFMGDSELNAGEGNLSGAMTVAYGFKYAEESSNSIFGSSTGEYTLSQSKVDTALVFGYRTSQNVMIYGGPFVQWNSFDGRTKTYAAVAPSTYSGHAKLMGANAGVKIAELGKPTFIGFSVYLEAGYYIYKIGSTENNNPSVGTSFEFKL